MGKTYRRNQPFKVKGKDFKQFKKSNKFKKWNEKTHRVSDTDSSEKIEPDELE